MSAETDLRALLLADPAVAALVGTRVAAYVMPADAPMPFVVFGRTGTANVECLDGESLGAACAFELQIWAPDRATTTQVADAVEAALRASPLVDVQARSGGFDEELGKEMETIALTLWT